MKKELDYLSNLLSHSKRYNYERPETTAFQHILKTTLDAISSKGKYQVASHDFLNLLKECHPFVFFPNDTEGKHYPDPYEGELDTPFPVISIEVINHAISIPAPNTPIEEMVWISCLIVHEVQPKKYEFYASFQRNIKKNNEIVRINGLLGPIKEEDDHYVVFKSFVAEYLNRLHKEKIGVTGRLENIKYKIGSEKKFLRPKNITYVSPVKYIQTTESNSHKNITWTHRWEVRGHWRKTSTIGKDRDGNYCVHGYTWVKPSIKGPQNSPLIKKSRLVMNYSEE